MGWKILFGFVFFLMVVVLLLFYWFVPTQELVFTKNPYSTSNFSISNSQMQFYPNMRFPSNEISYKIIDCPLQKENDMTRAFQIMQEKTILKFHPTNSNEEISITCDDKNKIQGSLFIAGEGGPTNITKSGDFNVITKGKILLIKESTCPNPNIATHELLHVLGLNHSENPANIMYYLSECDQTIGDDIISLLNNLYQFPSAPDLTFEDVSATMHSRYLDTNISIRNIGLKKSEDVKIIIFADEKNIKEIDIGKLEIGTGKIISLTNILSSVRSPEKLEYFINYPLEELKKENNKIVLQIK